MDKVVKKYIELLDEEIRGGIDEQAKNGITRQEEYDLHVLLENRKHAQELFAEKNERPTTGRLSAG